MLPPFCYIDLLLYSTELHSLCCLLKWVWSRCIGDIDVDNRYGLNAANKVGVVLIKSGAFGFFQVSICTRYKQI